MQAQDKQYWWTGGNDNSQGIFVNRFGTKDATPVHFITTNKPSWTLGANGRLIGFPQNNSCGTPLHKFEL